MQNGIRYCHQIPLFAKFLQQRLLGAHSIVHPAARQMPAECIGVANKVDPAARIGAERSNGEDFPAEERVTQQQKMRNQFADKRSQMQFHAGLVS